ncbi:MAG: hypothetical protein NPIRA02_02960 [Nitrospirales bacterium]|nr:MAG: hypothetical protein NPIRA02_02960 [Nitrospirales bacterium]
MLFKKILCEGSIVLDIGGHKGNYSRLFSAMVGKTGKVYSFEPHPDLYPHLENVAVHCPLGNIFPFSYALSDSLGQAALYSGNDQIHDQASTICVELATSDRLGQNLRNFQVKTIPLDFFCKEIEVFPDFVKIDVEGAEDRVISGMRETLRRFYPTVLFEFGLNKWKNQVPQHLKTLRDFGYTLYLTDFTKFLGDPPYSWENTINSSNENLGKSLLEFSDDELLSTIPFHTNVLAIQRERDRQIFHTTHFMPLSEAVPLLT